MTWTVFALHFGLLLICVGLEKSVGQTRIDTYIPVGSQDSLDATYFIPLEDPPSTGYPALIFVHGFGLDKSWEILNCRTYAQLGYISLCFSVRGHGNSSGLSRIMSTRERGDFRKVIEFVRGISGVDTLSIGIIGGSQGGLHALWAAADAQPVQAVSADVIVPRWASDMFANGSIRRTYGTLLTAATVRYDAVRDTLWSYLRKDAYEASLSLFNATRDLDTLQLLSSATPVLLFLKWQDHYFGPSSGIDFFDQYNNKKKIYLGTGGHYSDPSMSEFLVQFDFITRWFGYYLKHEATGILDEPVVTYAYSSLPVNQNGYFSWDHVASATWPPSEPESLILYFNGNATLTHSLSADHTDYVLEISNTYRDPAYTFEDAFNDGFQGPQFDAALPKDELVFTSSVLPRDLYWMGAPEMKLFVHSDNSKFPIHAQIYEIDAQGNKSFINRINLTVRDWLPGASGMVRATGIPHAHKFSQGNRIRVELTNIDKTNRPLLGSFPFVFPIFYQCSVRLLTNALQSSFIQFPVLQTLPSPKVASFRQPEETGALQNYPNPFNTSTIIGYELTAVSQVKLTIYDLLGKEVARLVDERREAGSHSVHWSPSGVASGIYFCVLRTDQSVVNRKLVILR